MLTHRAVWQALDRIARERGMSPSGMAKSAGLDPTTFNRSKRITAAGRERWPSTESVSKVLDATNTSLAEFVDEVDRVNGGRGIRLRALPAINMDDAMTFDCFDTEGAPAGDKWDSMDIPVLMDNTCFIIEMNDDSMDPVIRRDDVLVVSPDSGARRGDRALVRLKDGTLLVRELLRRTVNRIEVLAYNKDPREEEIDPKDLDWLARIVCIAQFHS
jgi:phage repressor protein C with HTH and peptisase S24 domain